MLGVSAETRPPSTEASDRRAWAREDWWPQVGEGQLQGTQGGCSGDAPCSKVPVVQEKAWSPVKRVEPLPSSYHRRRSRGAFGGDRCVYYLECEGRDMHAHRGRTAT